MVIISLLSLACVNANDLDESDLNQGDSQLLEISEESSDVALTSSDALSTSETMLEISEEAGDSTPTSGELLSTSEAKSDSQSQSYLILDNDADIENIYIGDYVTWIVSVINKGPDTAKNVKVYDQLPDGLKYIKHTTTKGTFDPETGIWSIGNLSISDGEVFLNIITQAFSVGKKINKAKVTSDTYNLNENESYEEEEIDVFEHEVNAYAKKSIVSSYTAGNPMALIVLSLFTILITSIKTK
ncbi:DUF11 domain-containing protein [Methanobrevibacter sp.]|uniref:DUF11 domain-containing protein n=1 Tax=Methanobrevibacter sp. TaxID=66852 RepID=UPI0025E18CFA|nr:DUF11 domain-containing protein [Methanobrevibacter sp.]MBR4448201.1 DUF11 domain-containing protein [Methanobrevibacter sp.]